MSIKNWWNPYNLSYEHAEEDYRNFEKDVKKIVNNKLPNHFLDFITKKDSGANFVKNYWELKSQFASMFLNTEIDPLELENENLICLLQ